MSVKQFLMELVFKGNSTQAKAAANEVKQAVAGVSAETDKAAKATDKETASTKKNTEAKKRAAAAALEQAAAEKKARADALNAGTGVGPAGQGLPSPMPAVPASPSSRPQSELDDIRAKYVPLFAAQRTYQKELDAIAKAEKSGALTSQEVAAAQARVRGSYEHSIEAIKRTDAALQGNTRTMQLQRHEARVLSYQVTDTWQSLMLGMPPLQILMQQGPQVIDVFGGIGNTLRHMRQFLTPARVGLGLLAGTAVAGVSSWTAYLKSTKEVETAHAGLGRGLATSSAQLEAAARAGASAAGISIKAARSMEVQFLRTGRIGAEHYDDLIGLSKDFAATLGLEPEAAGAQLAEMFSDPAKAADTLYQKYGLIDAATMRYAQTLVAQNRAGDAQAVLLDALPDKLANAERALTGFQRVRENVGNFLGDFGDRLGEAVDGAIEIYTGKGPATSANDILTREFPTPSVIPSFENSLFGSKQEKGDRYRAEYNSLYSAAGYEALSSAYYDPKKAERVRQGKNALTLAEGSGATSRMRQEEALRNQIAALQAGVGAPGQDSFQQAEIQQALEAKKRVLEALIAPQQRLNELDRLDAQIAAERNPVLRAEMEARRARLQMADQEVSQAEIDTAASRARLKVIEQTIASSQTQVSDMRAETEIRIRLTEQVAAGIIKSEDVNRLLQEELMLRPLVAAAAAAEGEEKTRLTEIVDQMRQAYEDQAGADKTADRTSKLRDYLKTQQESMAQLRLEQSLIGQSEAIRSRTLALFEAEKEIRELGLSGKQADQIREEAAQMADLERQVDRIGEAWDRVSSSSEDAIDALLDGDFSGALDGLRDQLMDLAVNNPLKNALLGTDYGTLSDLGGLGGIWDRLMGKVPALDPAAAAAKAAAQSVATMQVTAANVTISTMGGLGGLGSAANINGLPGSSDVQSQIAAFFSGKGLAPHQVAGIMGNVSAESAFNPAAVGDGGTSFGLFQHHAGRGQGLLNAVGGMGGLGDVQAQLEHVWDELLTSENGVLKKLMASSNVQEATSAFVGFERPAGWSAANPMGADSWPTRLGAAEAAMTKFATTTDVATQGLGTLGGGFDTFGQALAQSLSGGAGGGDLLSGLIGPLLGAIGIPGYASGGATGGSDPTKVAGLVHEGEFVMNAATTRRIGISNLEAMQRGTMRGYATGGYVSSARAYPFLTSGSSDYSDRGNSTVVQIMPVNNSSVPLNMEVEETTGPRGQRQQTLVLSDAVATGMTGGAAKRQMQTMYGARQRGIGRG